MIEDRKTGSGDGMACEIDFISSMPNVPQVPFGNVYRFEEIDFKGSLVRLHDESLSERHGKKISLYVDTKTFGRYFHKVERLK